MPLSQSHQYLSLSQVTLPDRHGEQTGCTTIRDSGSEKYLCTDKHFRDSHQRAADAMGKRTQSSHREVMRMKCTWVKESTLSNAILLPIFLNGHIFHASVSVLKCVSLWANYWRSSRHAEIAWVALCRKQSRLLVIRPPIWAKATCRSWSVRYRNTEYSASILGGLQMAVLPTSV